MTGPTRRQRFKPFELLGIALAFGVFAGLVGFVASHSAKLALIFAVVAFIGGLLLLAMLALAAGTPGDGDTPYMDRERPPRRRRR